jgi:hypothetical protein
MRLLRRCRTIYNTTVRHDALRSQSLVPSMEQATISQPSPRRVSYAVADIRFIHSSPLISDSATLPNNFNSILSPGVSGLIASPTPARTPTPERRLLSIRDFADAFTAVGLTLTFPHGPAPQEGHDKTLQTQSHGTLPDTFEGATQIPSLVFLRHECKPTDIPCVCKASRTVVTTDAYTAIGEFGTSARS